MPASDLSPFSASIAAENGDKFVSLSVSKPVTSNSAVSFEFDYVDQQTRLDYLANDIANSKVPGT